MESTGETVRQEMDGSRTVYDEVDVTGDRVERLMTEIFTEHWAAVTVGPITRAPPGRSGSRPPHA